MTVISFTSACGTPGGASLEKVSGARILGHAAWWLKLDTKLGWGSTAVAEMVRAARVRAGFHVNYSDRAFADCLSLRPYRLACALEMKLGGMRDVIGSACMWGTVTKVHLAV